MDVPFGRGRNSLGRGFWKRGVATGAYPYAYWSSGVPGTSGAARWGRGNPYPFCRRFPYMPRGWWAMPQYAGGLRWPVAGGWGMTPGIWQQPGGSAAPRF